MKAVEVLFSFRVCSFNFKITITNRLYFILKFILLTLVNYEITLMINIVNHVNSKCFINSQSMVQYIVTAFFK